MKDVIFVTGNQHKADYIAKLLGLPLAHRKIDLDEIQAANGEDVVRHKVQQAYDVVKQPVIVEDFSFCIRELNDLPGPFIKFFTQPEDGLEKLCRLTDALASRAAKLVSVIAYKDAATTRIFVKELTGQVATEPRGELGIATDKIFEPDGYGGKTRSELSPEHYDEVFAKVRPLVELREFLLSHGYTTHP